jgi:hypothetical protein
MRTLSISLTLLVSFISFAWVNAYAAEKSETTQLICTLDDKLFDQFFQLSKRVPKPTRKEMLAEFKKVGFYEVMVTLNLNPGGIVGGVAILSYGGKAHQVGYMITDTTVMLMTADNTGTENSWIDRMGGTLHISIGNGGFLGYECEKQAQKF